MKPMRTIIAKLRKQWNLWRRRRAIERIRRNLVFWGVDTMNYSDSDIENMTVNFSRLLGQCGITCDQATEALHSLVKNVSTVSTAGTINP